MSHFDATTLSRSPLTAGRRRWERCPWGKQEPQSPGHRMSTDNRPRHKPSILSRREEHAGLTGGPGHELGPILTPAALCFQLQFHNPGGRRDPSWDLIRSSSLKGALLVSSSAFALPRPCRIPKCPVLAGLPSSRPLPYGAVQASSRLQPPEGTAGPKLAAV